MPSKSKRKGNAFERALVEQAKAAGLGAERAYASNGKSLGQPEECDLVLCYPQGETAGEMTIQAKKRESFGGWLWDGLANVDVFVISKNRKEPLAILPYEKLLELLK